MLSWMTAVAARSRLWTSALVAIGVALVWAVGSMPRTGAAFSGTTQSAASIDAGALVGVHAPDDGVARFAALASPGSCGLSWTALAGGTAVADRFEVTDEPDGTVLTTTAGVGAGATVIVADDAVTSYRLRTRAALSWVSPDPESASTTCLRPGLVSIATGETATCGIDTAGHLWCWGLGFDQATGEDGYLTQSTPRQEGSATWRQLDMGSAHTCGVQTDGSAWCWGYNWAGQLGAGDTTYRTDPVQVGAATDWEVVALSANTSCGIRTGGTLWCWGYNQFGQAGDGTTTDRWSPVQIGVGSTWASVAGGKDHSCATTDDGELWCWGANWSNQVGVAGGANQTSPVRFGTDSDWSASLGLGDFHSCAVKIDSSMWCWGSNWHGEGGHATVGASATATEVSSGWAQVDAGRRVTCATRLDRTLWCTGVHADGRTGLGLTSGSTAALTQVGSADTWRLLSYGARHGCGVHDDGTLECWGNAGAGQTGQGATTWASPNLVGSATDWIEVSLGDRSSCGIRAGGSLWCWGWNVYGQIGQGDEDDGYTTPTQVAAGSTWTDVATSELSACAVRSDGTMWCWGANWWGMLGDGSYTNRYVPTQAGVDTNWESVTVGRGVACGIKTNGELWCWGANWEGQAGTGTFGNSYGSPVRVGTKIDWAQVSAANNHTCAVDDATDLWCWGSDAWGKLGNGVAGTQHAPQLITSGVAQVDTGDEHTCAVLTSGRTHCWGRNRFGAVGDGTSTDRDVPIEVSIGGTNWRQVTAGHGYSCATRTDDTVYCWGSNGAGQFGIGTTSTANLSPVLLYGGTAQVEASSGRVQTCGIATGGNLACAGNNAWSQLGYNDATPTPTPVAGGVGPWEY